MRVCAVCIRTLRNLNYSVIAIFKPFFFIKMEDPQSPEKTSRASRLSARASSAGLNVKKLDVCIAREVEGCNGRTVSSSPSCLVQSFKRGSDGNSLYISSPTRKRLTVGSIRTLLYTSPKLGPSAHSVSHGHVCFNTYSTKPIRARNRLVYTKFKVFHAKVYKTMKEEARPTKYITHKVIANKYHVRFTKFCPDAVVAYANARASPKKRPQQKSLKPAAGDELDSDDVDVPEVRRASAVMQALKNAKDVPN